MFLITELNEDTKVTSEEVVLESGVKQKNFFIEGVYMQGGIVNRNKRFYPPEVLANEVSRYDEQYVKRGSAYGELGHPSGPGINLPLVSHRVVELRRDGNDFYGKSIITDTPNGRIARGIMESGGKLGVSSRGMGTLVPNRDGIMEVQKDFRLAAAADIVADPSAPSAWVNGIYEGAEWVMDPSGNWRAVAPIVEGVKKMSRTQLEEGAVAEFRRYMSTLRREFSKSGSR